MHYGKLISAVDGINGYLTFIYILFCHLKQYIVCDHVQNQENELPVPLLIFIVIYRFFLFSYNNSSIPFICIVLFAIIIIIIINNKQHRQKNINYIFPDFFEHKT